MRGRERERRRETSVCCSTYVCIYFLILVCALTGDWTSHLGLLGRFSNKLSYLTRAVVILFSFYIISLLPYVILLSFIKGSISLKICRWPEVYINSSYQFFKVLPHLISYLNLTFALLLRQGRNWQFVIEKINNQRITTQRHNKWHYFSGQYTFCFLSLRYKICSCFSLAYDIFKCDFKILLQLNKSCFILLILSTYLGKNWIDCMKWQFSVLLYWDSMRNEVYTFVYIF